MYAMAYSTALPFYLVEYFVIFYFKATSNFPVFSNL